MKWCKLYFLTKFYSSEQTKHYKFTYIKCDAVHCKESKCHFSYVLILQVQKSSKLIPRALPSPSKHLNSSALKSHLKMSNNNKRVHEKRIHQEKSIARNKHFTYSSSVFGALHLLATSSRIAHFSLLIPFASAIFTIFSTLNWS